MADIDLASPQEIWGSFDRLDENIVSGWAWNRRDPSAPAELEFYLAGELVGSATANLFRADVRDAGFGSGYAGFTTTLKLPATAQSGAPVHAYLRGREIELTGSPRQLKIAPHIRKWLNRSSRLTRSSLSRLKRRCNRQARGSILSIVIPFYDTKIAWLIEAVESVMAQWCDHWELICVDDASPDPRIGACLARFAALDSRIKYLRLPRNSGIAAAVNAGIRHCSGDYIGFMDHDDYLEPDAVYKFLVAARSGADLMYCDELITGEKIEDIISVAARPAFSHDYYLSHPYFVHMIVVKRALAWKIQGWNESFRISADIDFVLRIIENSRLVAHIPAVLYRWRTHGASAGHRNQDEVMAAMLTAISNHLTRMNFPATVACGPTFNHFRVNFRDDQAQTLIVIPTKNRADILRNCIESIERTTDPAEVHICIVDHESNEYESIKYLSSLRRRHIIMPYHGTFNYSAINNCAVRQYGRGFKHILFMNNDVQAIHEGWLERMRSLSARADVGVVGATLLYGDGRVQHSGVIVGLQGAADHAHRFKPFVVGTSRNEGYLSSLVSLREYSAVTAACMMIKLSVFEAVGGFDEGLAVGFNDTDLCLRIFSRGLKILNDPYTVLFHHESATRRAASHTVHPKDNAFFAARWKSLIDQGDFYYNPLLSVAGGDHELAANPWEARNVGVPRLVNLG